MHEGYAKEAPGLYRRVSWWLGSQRGHFVIDAGVALSLITIVLAQSWARQGPVTRWRVHNAAQLLARDLRLTQHTAVAISGNGSWAELCLRSDGYDVYTIAPQDPAGQTAHPSGTRIKSVTSGQEYARGIDITPDASATYNCTADATRRAFVYLASGAPKFPDAGPHSVAVTLQGQALHVTVQPGTGATRVNP